MKKLVASASITLLVLLLIPGIVAAQAKPRARDLGIPFDGTPGPLDAITTSKASRSATPPWFPAAASWS